jgi:hypothetical protein
MVGKSDLAVAQVRISGKSNLIRRARHGKDNKSKENKTKNGQFFKIHDFPP